MADDLDHLIVSRPETLSQGIQLTWLYTLVSGAVDHGRMDIYLGDLLTRDLDNGRLTEEESLRLLQALWRMIANRDLVFSSRIMLGGRGRRNPAKADRFALLAMEATRTVLESTPQLCLRVHRGMSPGLLAKAFEVIGEGRTFPILYNDDVIIPEVARVFDVPEEDAEHYFPYGDGEYALDHRSFGSPSCRLNLLKTLEVTLHNGRDPRTGKSLGLALGEFRDFRDFEELFAAFGRQMAYFAGKLARRHVLEFEVENDSVALLYPSMLYNGCLENGHSVVDRGPVYTGGVVESHGLINAADSLTAIRHLVYENGLMTPDEMLAGLEGRTEDAAARVQLMRAAPKFGHDDEEADAMVCRVSDQAAMAVRQQAEEVDLDFFLLVHITNRGNATAGKDCEASADGRPQGAPLAAQITPAAGADHRQIVGLLNSLAAVESSVHTGYIHHLRFDRDYFQKNRPKMEALLDGYFESGGSQVMVSVVSRSELEAARAEPARHPDLIVRVGRFSARFIELPPEIQREMIDWAAD
ncbi:MAG: pyruvate formate lyase family protein [Opitutaceae bacterium]